MSEQKTKLTDEDFKLLLPSRLISVGNSKIEITPLGIAELKSILQRVNLISADLAAATIDGENYMEADKLFKLVEIIMDKAPDILSDASKIAVEDLLRLPLAPNVEILRSVLEINIESQEGLEKNLSRLAEMIGQLRGAESPPPTTQDLGHSAKGSSKKGTRGKKSKSIH